MVHSQQKQGKFTDLSEFLGNRWRKQEPRQVSFILYFLTCSLCGFLHKTLSYISHSCEQYRRLFTPESGCQLEPKMEGTSGTSGRSVQEPFRFSAQVNPCRFFWLLAHVLYKNTTLVGCGTTFWWGTTKQSTLYSL